MTLVAPGMILHAKPVASQRGETTVDVIGASPLKEPTDAVSCLPSPTVPLTDGALTVVGAKCCLSMTGNEWFVMPTSEPATWGPVIQTRIVRPMSATFGVYVDAVAPTIGTQLGMSPGALQRRQE